MNATQEEADRFKTLLVKVEKEQPDNEHFINLIKNSIEELESIHNSRNNSQQYLAKQWINQLTLNTSNAQANESTIYSYSNPMYSP